MSKQDKPNLQALREVLDRNNYLIFDTETSGLKSDAEIIQLAALHSRDGCIIDTLVRPTRPIPPEAIAVHHITTEMAERDGRRWVTVYETLMDILDLDQCDLVSYNLVYDSRMIIQTCKSHAIDSYRWLNYLHQHPGTCAMIAYSEYHSAWDDHFQSFKWQKLSEAAVQQNLEAKDAHSALGDCLMTAALCLKMHGETKESSSVPD